MTRMFWSCLDSLCCHLSVLPSSSFRANCAQKVRWRGSNQLLTQARSSIDVCILYVCGFLSRMPDHANSAHVTEHCFVGNGALCLWMERWDQAVANEHARFQSRPHVMSPSLYRDHDILSPRGACVACCCTKKVIISSVRSRCVVLYA